MRAFLLHGVSSGISHTVKINPACEMHSTRFDNDPSKWRSCVRFLGCYKGRPTALYVRCYEVLVN